MKTLQRWSISLTILFAAAIASAASDQPATPAAPAAATASIAAEPVYTRARVASFSKESDGKLYVQLKLLPKSKLPFTTQTFRVQDRSLLADVAEGAWVRFRSTRIDGENVVTALQVIAECKRFQTCE